MRRPLAHPPESTLYLRLETDREYRARIVERASGWMRSQAETAFGATLDEVGAMVDLQRRIVEGESASPGART